MIRSETEFAFVLYRTQLFDPGDIENVKRIQAGYKVQTLSQFLGSRRPRPRPPWSSSSRSAREDEKHLARVLQRAELHPAVLPDAPVGDAS